MSLKLLLLAALASLLLQASAALAADWKPAKSPLMTRWAKDVSPDHVWPEYPRPQMVRKDWLNLNGLWQFTPTDAAAAPTPGQDLPGQILVPFPMESALSGVGQHHDHALYRRTFSIPKSWADQHVLLHFGAVDYVATVWVNGKQIGSHTGGYDAFSFDITDALTKDGNPNELLVAVTDTTADTQARGKQTASPHGIFYTPCSGIWQTVWLEPVPAAGWTNNLRITPDIDAGEVRIGVEANAGLGAAFIAIVSDGNQEIGRTTAKVGHQATIKIPDAKLWTSDTPFLYRLKIGMGDDHVDSYFGMRKISLAKVDGVNRLLLNNKYLFQIGPLDQGFWPDGIYTAPTDEAMRFDIETLKKLGFNMLRKHVKVEPQRYYYWCDKLGILVWQDMPSQFAKSPGDWQKQFEHQMQALVEQHINSPSIVMWVPFNEGWGQDGPYGKAGTTRIANWLKQLDPSRLVDDASGWTDAGAGDVHDIHHYPNPAAPPLEDRRAVVLGEFGGLGLRTPGHMWSQNDWGYQGMADRDDLSNRYVKLLGRLWDLAENHGLSAGVYTQTTDVETEANGLLTYDRAVLKVDPDKIRAANTGHIPRTEYQPVVPTAEQQPIDWRYTTDKPADGWQQPDFDDSTWKTAPAGFGTQGTPGAVVRTTWNTPDIYLRRTFNLPPGIDPKDLQLSLHHDEDCTVYINGVQATHAARFTTEYSERAIATPALATLKPANNTFAVHCHNTTGGQYIDVGLVRIVEKPRPAK